MARATKQAQLAGLARTNRRARIEIEGKVLIEDDSHVSRADFHLGACPSCHSWLDPFAGFFDLGHDAVVTLHLAQPGSGFLDARREFIAESQERAEIIRPNVFRFESGSRVKSFREGLIGRRQPNHSPLANGELRQSD